MSLWSLLTVMNIFLTTVVAAPTAANPQCSSLRRGFHCATARLQDESKSDKRPSSSSSSSSSTTYHEHYQAHSAEQDTAATSQEEPPSDPAAEEASRANTRSVSTKKHSKKNTVNSTLYTAPTCRAYKVQRFNMRNSR